MILGWTHRIDRQVTSEQMDWVGNIRGTDRQHQGDGQVTLLVWTYFCGQFDALKGRQVIWWLDQAKAIPIPRFQLGLKPVPTKQNKNFSLNNIVISSQIDTLQGDWLGGQLEQADYIPTTAPS